MQRSSMREEGQVDPAVRCLIALSKGPTVRAGYWGTWFLPPYWLALSEKVDREEVDRLRKRFMKLDKVDKLCGNIGLFQAIVTE